MYEILKPIYKILIPKKLQFRIEPIVRRLIYYLFYKGEEIKCSVCFGKSKKFIDITFFNSIDKICAKCGSLSRSRALALFIEKKFSYKNQKILDFSPHRSLYEFFKSKFKYYEASDYENQFYAPKKIDITSVSEINNTYDLIICFHILEHILDDKKALEELLRVLKNNGDLLIQVPIKKGGTYQDNSITSKDERLKAFGQEDHVRVYGEESILELLNESGFEVEMIDIVEDFEDKSLYGLSEKEIIFWCRKSKYF